MKRNHISYKKNKFHIKKICVLQAVTLMLLLVILWVGACKAMTYAAPAKPRVDIREYLMQETGGNKDISAEQLDLDLIYEQTGLGRAGVETLINENRLYKMGYIQDYFYGTPVISESRLNVVRHLERVDGVYDGEMQSDSQNADGKTLLYPRFVVEDGDIIVTLSSYIGGWRYGHTGLVVNADEGLVLEAMTYGEPSLIENLGHWKEYPAWAILRPRNLTREQRAAVAEYAYDNLRGIDYSLLASTRTSEVGKPGDPQALEKAADNGTLVNDANISRTQCAHIAWYAYYLAGLDLDSDWTDYVTPADILRDDDLELVLEYGFLQNIFEGRR